jgi:hypothetical protein
VVLLALDRLADHLLFWWSDGGMRWVRVVLRPAPAPGAVRTSGSGPRMVGVARSTVECGATVTFTWRRRRAAMRAWLLLLGGLASTTGVW